MRDWARLYQTPLWLLAGFIVLLTLFAVTPDPSRNAADARTDPTSEPTPGPRECVICGIDQECDPSSGRCVFVKATPLPCVETAKFDEKAGFCLPTGAPPPVPTPEPTFEFPRTNRTDRTSRFPEDFPFQDSEDRRDRDEDTGN
ncbi:MAG: hypothetical protein ACRDKJ_14265 [Actinomycetota bacterium]